MSYSEGHWENPYKCRNCDKSFWCPKIFFGKTLDNVYKGGPLYEDLI